MTEEKLHKAKVLFMDINDCKYEIKEIHEMLKADFKYFYLTGETKDCQDKSVKLSKETFDIFLNKVLSEYQDKLSELETQFNNL